MTRQTGLLDVLWSCVVPAAGQPVNGSGIVDAQFDLSVGQTMTLEVSSTPDVIPPFFDLRVQVYAPASITAVFTDNDADVLIEAAGAMGIIRDGFERCTARGETRSADSRSTCFVGQGYFL